MCSSSTVTVSSDRTSDASSTSRSRVGPGAIPRPIGPSSHDQDGVGAGGRRIAGRLEAGDARPDHQDLDVLVSHHLSLGGRGLRQRAEAGGPADHALGHRPGEPRPDERLVVEAHRHHAVQRVGHVHQVAIGVGPPARALHAHALAARGGARVHRRAGRRPSPGSSGSRPSRSRGHVAGGTSATERACGRRRGTAPRPRCPRPRTAATCPRTRTTPRLSSPRSFACRG